MKRFIITERFTGYADIEIDAETEEEAIALYNNCLLYTSPSPRDLSTSRMPSSA